MQTGNNQQKQCIQKDATKKSLGKQWRITELPEVRKKEYKNKRRRYLLNVDLGNWNVSEVTMTANPSIKN